MLLYYRFPAGTLVRRPNYENEKALRHPFCKGIVN